MGDLKPCPFCGSTDIAANSFAIEASVRCFDCFAVLVRKHPRNTDGGLAAVIEAWNTRADLSDALLREAMEALGKLHHAVCGETGFAHCVRLDSGMAYPWPALDDADENARATLAKLRSHMGGNHE